MTNEQFRSYGIKEEIRWEQSGDIEEGRLIVDYHKGPCGWMDVVTDGCLTRAKIDRYRGIAIETILKNERSARLKTVEQHNADLKAFMEKPWPSVPPPPPPPTGMGVACPDCGQELHKQPMIQYGHGPFYTGVICNGCGKKGFNKNYWAHNCGIEWVDK